MPRVPFLTDQEADREPASRAFFEGCRELIGRVPNSMRVYGRLPEIAPWFLAFLVSLQREGAGGHLDGRTKELVVLKTSMTNACDYCVTHNTSLGLATGITESEIDAVAGKSPATDVLADRDRAVLRWTEAVTKNVADKDKAAFEALREWFDDDAIVELTWLSAMFNMLNRVHDSLQIDLEKQDEVDLIKHSTHMPKDKVRAYLGRMLELLKETEPTG